MLYSVGDKVIFINHDYLPNKPCLVTIKRICRPSLSYATTFGGWSHEYAIGIASPLLLALFGLND